ncbi:MAG TPA: hypothetical protein ENL09_06080 [Bacteroidetes bacterium]|nr:hypothetical protein [Bacteroidota bacterium]
MISVHIDPNIYDGKYFIVFSTVDKQTGLDHYEILEITPEELEKIKKEDGGIANFFNKLFGKWEEKSSWKEGESPYLLADQSLGSVIKVKAIDKAGNERLVEYNMEVVKEYKAQGKRYIFGFGLKQVLIEVGALALLILVMVVVKKKKSNS